LNREERTFLLDAPTRETLEFLVAEKYLLETQMDDEAAIRAVMSQVWLALIRARADNS